CYFLINLYAAFYGFRRLYQYLFPSEFFGKAHTPGPFAPFLWPDWFFGPGFDTGGKFFPLFGGCAKFKKPQLVGTGPAPGKLFALFPNKYFLNLSSSDRKELKGGSERITDRGSGYLPGRGGNIQPFKPARRGSFFFAVPAEFLCPVVKG